MTTSIHRNIGFINIKTFLYALKSLDTYIFNRALCQIRGMRK